MINWIKTLFLMVFIIGILSCNENKQSDNSSVFQKNIEQILDNEVLKLQEEYKVPAVGVGLIESGKILTVKVYGEHQLGNVAPENTIFNVASITKVITTMTTLKLIDDANWNLDEPLSRYWVDPDIIDNPLHEKITTRHALSHTIGFKNWRRMTNSGSLEFDFEPGTKYQYSGEGMEYLKNALENRFGKDLEALADSLLFEPLNMKDATLKWIPETDTLRFAKWYDINGKEHNIENYRTPNADAADDLLITVRDLAKFGIAVMDSSIIKNQLFNEMVSPQSKIHNNANQGLGWTIIDGLGNNEYAINHDGGDIGVATTIILLPKSNSGIIVFTNGDNGRIVCNAIVRKVFSFGDKIIKKLYWGGEIPDIITISPENLEKFSGSYLTNQGTLLSFFKRNNALKIEGEGVPGVEIYPKSDTEFFPADFEVFFRFTNTGEGMKFELMNQGKIVLQGIKSR